MKKILLPLFSVLFLSISLYAQDSGWRLGFEVALVRADVQSDFNVPDRLLLWNEFPGSGNSSGNYPGTGFSVGFVTQYEISDWVSMVAKTNFTSLSTEIEGRVYERPETTPVLPEKLSGTSSIYYFDAQLGAKIYTNQSRLQFFAYPYLESNFYLGNQYNILLTYPTGTTSKLSAAEDRSTSFNSPIFTAGLGLGIEFELTERINLDLMPTLEYAFSQLAEPEDGDLNPSNIHVVLGFSYGL